MTSSKSTPTPPSDPSDLLEVELPYGRSPLRVVGARSHIEVLRARELEPPTALDAMIDAALDQPLSSKRLSELVQPNGRMTVIVSDSTRDEPRASFLRAIRRRVPPSVRVTIAVATGTHGPCSVADLGLDEELLHGAELVMHDGHSDASLVELGTTAHGTPVRVHRAVVDAELVVATGCIRPHYFAGFGAGIKAIFPGLGQAAAIRSNHRLKSEPGARAGIVDGNPCREDLRAAVGMIATPMFLLNGVCAPAGHVQAVVAGDVDRAFNAGVELARPWFSVVAAQASLVIASDVLPVSASLYQAAKIAAAAAPLVAADGELVIAAECADGIGPLQTVNEAIFRIGVLPRLARGARISLVSALSRDLVEQTLLAFKAGLPVIDRRALILPRASQLICSVVQS
jgi:lactate racemase